MKKLILIGIVTLSLAFTITSEKNSANVETVNGINVFCFSKPTAKYEVLGTVKIKGMVSSEKGDHMVKLFTEKAKKDFTSVEAIIVNANFENAEAIKFN